MSVWCDARLKTRLCNVSQPSTSTLYLHQNDVCVMQNTSTASACTLTDEREAFMRQIKPDGLLSDYFLRSGHRAKQTALDCHKSCSHSKHLQLIELHNLT